MRFLVVFVFLALASVEAANTRSLFCDREVRAKYCRETEDGSEDRLAESCRSCQIGPTCPVQAN